MAGSCSCLSDKKVFLLNTTSVRLKDACPNESGMKVAQNLPRQDYEALGNCMPPEANSYAIRLTYNPIKIVKIIIHLLIFGVELVTTNHVLMASL